MVVASYVFRNIVIEVYRSEVPNVSPYRCPSVRLNYQKKLLENLLETCR
jgi:hypothetical protein